MRVIVCGSRSWTDRGTILARLIQLDPHVTIVHGDARGADRLAAEVAATLGFSVEAFPAEWDLYGRRAGHIRNNKMAAAGASLVIAFWDGRSKGTQNMLDQAAFYGIPYEVIRP